MNVTELYCRENLNLLYAIERDNELRNWFLEYPAHKDTKEHLGLCALLHNQILQRAYEDNIISNSYLELLNNAHISIDDIEYLSPLEIAEMGKYELIACISHLLIKEGEEGFYANTIGKGTIIPYIETYLELCE